MRIEWSRTQRLERIEQILLAFQAMWTAGIYPSISEIASELPEFGGTGWREREARGRKQDRGGYLLPIYYHQLAVTGRDGRTNVKSYGTTSDTNHGIAFGLYSCEQSLPTRSQDLLEDHFRYERCAGNEEVREYKVCIKLGDVLVPCIHG
jgi:hypothetical protein